MLITVSTVGFGDIAPKSDLGRVAFQLLLFILLLVYNNWHDIINANSHSSGSRKTQPRFITSIKVCEDFF